MLNKGNGNGHRISSSSGSCRSNNQSHGQYNNASTSTCNKLSGSNSLISHNPSSSGSQRHRKNVISCVTVGDSDNEDVSKTPKHNTGEFQLEIFSHKYHKNHIKKMQKQYVFNSVALENSCCLDSLK